MQDYMILRKDAHRVESGTGDKVIRDFRTRMEGRKQEAVSRHSTIRTLGTLCSVLSVAVLAGGVVMFNNYQKMKEMESVLVSVLPDNVKQIGEFAVPEEGGDFIVEEIRGSVAPETMGADVYASSAPAAESEPFILPEPEAQNDPAVLQAQGGQAQGGQVQGGQAQGGQASGAGKKAGAAENGESGEEGEASDTPVSGGNATADKDYPVTNMKPGETYLIGEGETLYGICFDLYGSLQYLNDIRALNHLDDADHIMAGQELILPDLS